MGTTSDMDRVEREATEAGLCGHQMGTAASPARACGKRAKYEATRWDGTRRLVCGVHKRFALRFGDIVTDL